MPATDHSYSASTLCPPTYYCFESTYWDILRLGSCQTYQLTYGHDNNSIFLYFYSAVQVNHTRAMRSCVYLFNFNRCAHLLMGLAIIERQSQLDTVEFRIYTQVNGLRHKSFNYLRSFYVQDRSCALAFRPLCGVPFWRTFLFLSIRTETTMRITLTTIH